MPDEFPIAEEPIIIPPIEIEPITLSDGTEIEVKPIPGAGAEYVDYRRKTGYTGDCTLKLTVTEGQDPAEIAEGIKAALEIELVDKTKTDRTPEETIALKTKQMTDAVQRFLDSTAQTRGYDGIMSACTYATSTNSRFQAEGLACVAWRDSVWAACYQILADVMTGTRLEPTLTEILSELPAMEWPE